MEQAQNPTATPRRVSRTVLLALIVLLSAWFLLWRIQSIPMFCALAYPCPRPGARLVPTLLYGGLMIIPFVFIVWVQNGRPGKYRNAILRTAFASLILLALVGIAAALFAGGFALGL
jgi:hypothetical protein